MPMSRPRPLPSDPSPWRTEAPPSQPGNPRWSSGRRRSKSSRPVATRNKKQCLRRAETACDWGAGAVRWPYENKRSRPRSEDRGRPRANTSTPTFFGPTPLACTLTTHATSPTLRQANGYTKRNTHTCRHASRTCARYARRASRAGYKTRLPCFARRHPPWGNLAASMSRQIWGRARCRLRSSRRMSPGGIGHQAMEMCRRSHTRNTYSWGRSLPPRDKTWPMSYCRRAGNSCLRNVRRYGEDWRGFKGAPATDRGFKGALANDRLCLACCSTCSLWPRHACMAKSKLQCAGLSMNAVLRSGICIVSERSICLLDRQKMIYSSNA